MEEKQSQCSEPSCGCNGPANAKAGSATCCEIPENTVIRSISIIGSGPCCTPQTDGAHGKIDSGSCTSESCGGNSDDVCCGAPPAPRADAMERPGYKLMHFVETFMDTPVGPVPRVETRLRKLDILGAIHVRLGFDRNNYRVAPGLYACGIPDTESPVLVTADYKLSFDKVRKELTGLDAWLLILDTRGINVWCAAGKELFSTAELIRMIKATRLDQVVSHRELILPQLGAAGVSAWKVKTGCGFKVIWGPVRACDIKPFLAGGKKADETMRRVTFSFMERLVLIPVELSFLSKHILWMMIALFVLSGIGSGFFSFSAGWHRGLMAGAACLAGIISGTVAVPLLLPWIPGRAFAVKGAILGTASGILINIILWPQLSVLELLAVLLFVVSLSSFLAMNFTGSTPFTSPTGVEKEMRKAIPFQAAAVIVAVVAWVSSGFAA